MQLSDVFRRKILVALFIITLGVFYANASADTMSEEGRLDPALVKGEIVKVTSIISGTTLGLDDGRQVKIVGVDVPTAYDAQAKKYLESFSGLDKAPSVSIRLYYGQAREDRYGRILAYPITMDWLGFAQSMVQQGHARAHGMADNRALAKSLLSLESESRGYRNGLWALPDYAVLSPEQVLDKKYWNSFQIIEGKVRDVAEVKKTMYLNFGDDWKTDFTAVIPPNARAMFTDEKIKPKDLKNIQVRVRGFVESKNGPSVELTHPELLEILEPMPVTKPAKAKSTTKSAK